MTMRFGHTISALRALRSGAVAVFRVGALAAGCLLFFPHAAHAQRSADLGLTYTQERSKFVGTASNDYFFVRGATVDFTYDVFKGLGVSANGTGVSTTNLNGRIDVEHIQFLVGPRFTYDLGHITDTVWGRKGAIFAEGKVGYTFAIAGQYPVNGNLTTSASALTYYGGGGINVHLYHRLDLRLIEAGEVFTQLPNGGNNRQNTLRLASGVNFHFGR